MDGENLGELFAAMALARQEFGAFTKSKTATIKSDKGSYGYSYADLSDIIEATAPALAKHGLVIIQEPEVINDGARQTVVISGCIAHKSGAVYMFRPLPLPVVGNTAQAIGSAISYARRYQLSALFNLAASDDDGQAAQDTQDAQARPQRTQAPAKAQSSAPVQNATPDAPSPLEQAHIKMDELGLVLYGQAWAKVLHQNVSKMTNGYTDNDADLSLEQVNMLIEGMTKLMTDKQKVAA